MTEKKLNAFLDDLPDRNCSKCEQCCIDYEGWLQFQNCLYNVCHFFTNTAFFILFATSFVHSFHLKPITAIWLDMGLCFELKMATK